MRKFLTVFLIICTAVCAAAFAGCLPAEDKPDEASYLIQYFDGEETRTISVKNGDLYSITVPYKEGYDFTGLYGAEEGGIKYVDANGSCTMPFSGNGNMVLYAQFAAKTFTVVFNYGEAGNADYVCEAAYGDKLPEPPAPSTLHDKNFEGWFTQENCGGTKVDGGTVINYKNIDKDNFSDGKLNLYAGFKVITYSVTFYSKDGSEILKTAEAEYGAALSEIGADIGHNGLTVLEWAYFMGGSAYTGEITSDMKLYAITYGAKVTLDYKDGRSPEIKTVKTGETLRLPEPDRQYYTFAGWFEGSEQADGYYTVPERNVTLSAKWNKTHYKLTFDTAGGTAVPSVMMEKGATILLASPIRNYYIFSGWFNGNTAVSGSFTMPEKDVTLTAKWEKQLTDYIYISTPAELAKVGNNKTAKYLLVNDVDLNGVNWAVINGFNGVFDGGGHAVYNFSVTAEQYYRENETVLGFFGELLSGATVKNLQIGKEGSATTISCGVDNKHIHAGVFAGYSAGKILNCRAVNCSVQIQIWAQSDKYKNWEFAGNAGGICGVVRGGTISGCYVTGSTLVSNTWTRFNNISSVARCGGIAGYADNSTVSDCFAEKTQITAYGETGDIEWWTLNKSGQPYAEAGGLMAHAVNVTVARCVVTGADTAVQASKKAGSYSNGDGAVYCGCMFGKTSGTTPSDLVGVNTKINCSGSNPSYPGFSIITENSYSALIAADSAFDNGLWISDNGAIALKFAE